jgi:hypothetical protein
MPILFYPITRKMLCQPTVPAILPLQSGWTKKAVLQVATRLLGLCKYYFS